MARDKIFKDTQDFKEQYRALCVSVLGREFDKCTDKERYSMLARLIAAKSRAIEAECHPKEAKKVYYFSLEFLLGPLLDNYLLNYGLRDLVADGIDEMGSSLDTLIKQEVDPGLGNGGLGRLAACFLDSMAHEGMAGFGNGMRYRYGLFRQEIEDGRQVECTDNWLEGGFPWESRKDGSSVTVRFGGKLSATRMKPAGSGLPKRAASAFAPFPMMYPLSVTVEKPLISSACGPQNPARRTLTSMRLTQEIMRVPTSFARTLRPSQPFSIPMMPVSMAASYV